MTFPVSHATVGLDPQIDPGVQPARLPTRYGDFLATAYVEPLTGLHHLALVRGEVDDGAPVLVRMHSECLTGDVFGSRRCDCGDQLDLALRRIAAEERGILLYGATSNNISVNFVRAAEYRDWYQDNAGDELEPGKLHRVELRF